MPVPIASIYPPKNGGVGAFYVISSLGQIFGNKMRFISFWNLIT